MKKSIFIFVAAITSTTALAGLPRTAITNMSVTSYAMYTTADPTCQTGLVATLPLSATPTTQNLAANPTLGSGPVSAAINCIVIVGKNQIGQSWAAGTYTGTSSGGADSQCNAGYTSVFNQAICRGVPSLSFPAQVTSDAAAAGLTLSTSCAASPTGNEIVPIYLSVNSACSGDPTSDPAACTAGGAHPNAFAAPTASGDTAHGVKLTAPAPSGTIYFVADPTNAIGGCGSVGPACIATASGNCGGNAPPKFYFHN